MATNRIESGKLLYDSGVKPIYNNDGTFSILYKNYKFNETDCSCMDKITRHPAEGCKHNNFIKIWLQHNKDPRKGEIENLQERFKDLILYMEKNGNAVRSETLYEEFGEIIVNDADTHNVISKAGRMFILIL